MNKVPSNENTSLASKIAQLVEERGWNQERFARESGLNRQTVRQILQGGGDRTLRNSTVSSCASALGLSVHELRNLPLEQLLTRMNNRLAGAAVSKEEPQPPANRISEKQKSSHPLPGPPSNGLKHLRQNATQPELTAWIDRNPDRANEFSLQEADELLDLQQENGGILASFGVEHFVEIIERKRDLIDKIHAISGTEYIDLLEKLVDLIYEKIQPYRDRALS